MAGKIQEMIDAIVEQRSGGNKMVAHFTRAKLALKGIDPSRYNRYSADDPDVIDRLSEIARELGLKLG